MKTKCLVWWLLMALCVSSRGQAAVGTNSFHVVIVGGTPGGLMAAIGAARGGRTVAVLERTQHIGGLPANGLGATDIATRGATGGLFLEFVGRIKAHYVKTYGADSQQVKDCSDGYHFEPSVAEKVFRDLLAEHPKISVLRMRQFDAAPGNVTLDGNRLTHIKVLNRETKAVESYGARVFIDATYEGDLAAAAGAPYRLGREAHEEFREPMAGQLYKQWGGPVGEGSTGLGDNAVQAFNYRLPLTRNPDIRVPIAKPQTYNRADYASLVADIKQNRTTCPPDAPRRELAFDGLGRVVNMVLLPNGKTDANNQHAAFVSTDLPEENWPWPTATWEWRDQFAQRLRDYTLGLLWFCQNDAELPEDFRQSCREWGLAKDEYRDNANFPRQVYVREGRRIGGMHLFTAHDALPTTPDGRPPVHQNSITASHYALDSHAVRKREPGRVHLDGFFSYPTKPYTVPYGVMVPQKVDGLLTPVPVSGTHIGFSTLRMEPCWMALGHAAGVAASLSIEQNVVPRNVNLEQLQRVLLMQGAVLMYYSDVGPKHPHFEALQYFGLRGLVPEWQAGLDKPATEKDVQLWMRVTKLRAARYEPGTTTRGEFLNDLYRQILLRK
ncbi:MAG: FAD-dependent oxidoreductase [Verrucomicrobiota bacterium]